MEGWSIVSWDDWTPSSRQSSKEATCKQVFCCRFSPATISKLSKTLHYTNPVWWLGLTGFKKPSNLQLHQNKCSRRWQRNWGRNSPSPSELGAWFYVKHITLQSSNRSLENSSPLWVLQSVDPQVAGGAPVTWEHVGFPQPGTCHWKPNYPDQPRYITVVKILWFRASDLDISKVEFHVWGNGIKCHIHGTPETGESHRSTGGAVTNCPAPCFVGFSTSSWLRSVPGSGCTKNHSWWQWAMQQNITYLRLNQTLATWMLEGPHMFSESKVKISFVYVLIIKGSLDEKLPSYEILKMLKIQ